MFIIISILFMILAIIVRNEIYHMIGFLIVAGLYAIAGVIQITFTKFLELCNNLQKDPNKK